MSQTNSKLTQILTKRPNTHVPTKTKKKKDVKRDERLRDLKTYKYFILLPDDPWKVRWDMLTTFLLFFTSFITPY